MVGQQDSPDATTDKLQTPCEAKWNEITALATCDEKWAMFQKNLSTCHKKLFNVDVVFDDLFFDIANCFQKEGNFEKEVEVLKAATKSTDWESVGPTSCSSNLRAKSLLESKSYDVNTCVNLEEFKKKIDQNYDLSKSSLIKMSLKDNPLNWGSFGSDDFCPDEASTLEAFLAQVPDLKVKEVQTEKTPAFVLFENPDRSKNRLLLFNLKGERCYYIFGAFDAEWMLN